MAPAYKNILIVRLSAIGDVALATAILPGIRRAMPDTRIHWLTEEMGGEVLGGNKDIDNLIILPRKRWAKLGKERKYLTAFGEMRQMRRQLRALGADLAIDAQGLLRSAFWTLAAHAKHNIGLCSQEGSQFLMKEVVKKDDNPSGRMCNDYRCLLEHMGVQAEPFAMSLCPTEQSREEAAAMLPANDSQQRPVMLYPFTTRPQKHWFDERWAELARRIASELKRPVWILGGPANESAAKAIAAASGVGESITIVAGKDSNIAQKMGLIERAAAAVGVDTGLSHISLGLGTPTVVMFGSTRIYTETSPLPGVILYDRMPCSPCNRHPSCGGDFTCMKKISVGNAFDALVKLLEGRA